MKKPTILLVTLLIIGYGNHLYSWPEIMDVSNFVNESLKTTEKMLKELQKISPTTLFNDAGYNIYKTKDGKKYGIEINLPGFKKEDIKVTLNKESKTITIRAESKKKKEEKTEEKNKEGKIYLYRSAFSLAQTSFARTLPLPENVDFSAKSKIIVKYDGRILTIELPLKQKEEKKQDILELEVQD